MSGFSHEIKQMTQQIWLSIFIIIEYFCTIQRGTLQISPYMNCYACNLAQLLAEYQLVFGEYWKQQVIHWKFAVIIWKYTFYYKVLAMFNTISSNVTRAHGIIALHAGHHGWVLDSCISIVDLAVKCVPFLVWLWQSWRPRFQRQFRRIRLLVSKLFTTIPFPIENFSFVDTLVLGGDVCARCSSIPEKYMYNCVFSIAKFRKEYALFIYKFPKFRVTQEDIIQPTFHAQCL